MSKIVSTHSFRGGTGKSNTTANLAMMVARAGKRVGVIDTDIQSPGIHVLFNLDQTQVHRTLNDYLWKRCAIEDAAHDVSAQAFSGLTDVHPRAKVFLIPSALDSGEIARVLREGYDVSLLNDGIQQVIRQLQLDYLFIDTHPGVNEETLLSIAISDVLILIMRPDRQDFQGTAVTAELARKLEVPEMLVVINKVPPDWNEASLREQITKSYQAEVAAMLPLNVDLARLASSNIFSNTMPDHPYSVELRKVAQRLLGNSTGS